MNLERFIEDEVKLDRWKEYLKQLNTIKNNLEHDLSVNNIYEDHYEEKLDDLIKNLTEEVRVLDYRLRDKI